MSLDRYRFTSADARVVESMARAYGGRMEPWIRDGREFWQVEIEESEVLVCVPGNRQQTIDQWYEKWDAGRLARRSDGLILLDGEDLGSASALADSCDCKCPSGKRGERDFCNPVTRFSFVIEGVDIVGVTRLEAGGFTAASELLGTIEWQHAQQSGAPFYAYLGLEERTVHRSASRSELNRTGAVRYMTPVLRRCRGLPEIDGSDATAAGSAERLSRARERTAFEPVTPAWAGPVRGEGRVTNDSVETSPQPSPTRRGSSAGELAATGEAPETPVWAGPVRGEDQLPNDSVEPSPPPSPTRRGGSAATPGEATGPGDELSGAPETQNTRAQASAPQSVGDGSERAIPEETVRKWEEEIAECASIVDCNEMLAAIRDAFAARPDIGRRLKYRVARRVRAVTGAAAVDVE